MFKRSLESTIEALKMSLQIISSSLDKVSVYAKTFGDIGGFATDQDKKWLELLWIQRDTETYRVESVRAMIIVDLYPASSCLKPLISSPKYLSLAHSRKLVRLLLDRDEQFRITCSNSLQALPHRSKGRLRAERFMSVVAPTISMSERRTALKASSSSLRSRTDLG
jgi:hypothetical protein